MSRRVSLFSKLPLGSSLVLVLIGSLMIFLWVLVQYVHFINLQAYIPPIAMVRVCVILLHFAFSVLLPRFD